MGIENVRVCVAVYCEPGKRRPLITVKAIVRLYSDGGLNFRRITGIGDGANLSSELGSCATGLMYRSAIY